MSLRYFNELRDMKSHVLLQRTNKAFGLDKCPTDTLLLCPGYPSRIACIADLKVVPTGHVQLCDVSLSSFLIIVIFLSIRFVGTEEGNLRVIQRL